MSDCRFGVSPVNYPDPEHVSLLFQTHFPLFLNSFSMLRGAPARNIHMRGGFETYRRRVVSLSKTLYSPKVLVNYPGSGGSVPT